MVKAKIAVFSGPNATISNSPTLVTSNKGRLEGENRLPGRFDHLVAQLLHEPVTVRIKKFSAHPLEEDAKVVYHNDGKDYYEVELRPEDGHYLLPYMARRTDGSPQGAPFEEADLLNPALSFGGRQFFYPDASRIFEDIDRTISGRDEDGSGNMLEQRADYDFIRVTPAGGYTAQGERLGEDFFPYKPFPLAKQPPAALLAKTANAVQAALATGSYAGCIWLEGSPTVEETSYWLSLLVDTDLPMAFIAAQRPHGQLSNDGDRNIVDAVDYVLSGQGVGAGAVGVQDEQIFAAREFKKADDRPGNYKATGGHGGILGSVGPPVTLWYRPSYKHTATSDVRITALPEQVEFRDRVGDRQSIRVRIKDAAGSLLGQAIPQVHIVKTAYYLSQDSTANPDHEVDILARINRGLSEQSNTDSASPKLHGFILEGLSPYGVGSDSQTVALHIAVHSGFPVVRVGRSDPGGMVPANPYDIIVSGSNLDATKARLLLMASMMKLGRLPKAKDPRNPTREEWQATLAKVNEYRRIIETH
jgi:L-asparaginase